MEVLSLLTVLGLGAVQLWVAIPTGLALQLHPLATGITAAVGALLGIMVVGLGGERLRTWLVRWLGDSTAQRHGRVGRFWTRYGVVGLGLVAPWLVGAPLGIAVGMTLGAPRGRLLIWMSIGAVLCTIGLTVACALGQMGLRSLTR